MEWRGGISGNKLGVPGGGRWSDFLSGEGPNKQYFLKIELILDKYKTITHFVH